MVGSVRVLALLFGLGLILGGCASNGNSATQDGYTAGGPPPVTACKLGHLLQGQAYCLPAPVMEARAPRPLYCFHSLGSVDCYATPDPYGIDASARTLEPAMVADPGPHGPLHLPELSGTANPPPISASPPSSLAEPAPSHAPISIAPLPPAS